MENFHVILVTARHHIQTAPVIRRLWDTSGNDVNIHLLDGTEGKSAVVNKFYKEHMQHLPDEDFYCVMDDDFIIPLNWQGYLRHAFDDIHNLGAAGFMFADTEEYRAYCAQWPELKQERATEFQELTRGNLVGAFICSKVKVARAIGCHPIDTDMYYNPDEDGWRCHRVFQLGLRLAYIKTHTPALIQPMQDTPSYAANKAACIERLHERGLSWLGGAKW